jgi:spore germination cell wall hydrolase CwlJ-like protein
MQLRLYLILTLLAASFIIYNIAVNKKIVDRLVTIGYTQLTEESQKEIDCLADNIYFEAGYEPEQGKVAVALVTMNRLQDPRFPKNICGVVKQKVRHTCQFTWFCENKSKNIKHNTTYWQAREVALHVYVNYDKISDITYGALYYHADYVNPRWKHLEKTAVVGRHIFYKESEKL